MHTRSAIILLSAWCLLVASCASTPKPQEEWKEQLYSNLAVMGARNWVVIAESGFPSLNGSATTTMVTDQDTPAVFTEVLDALETEAHVKPRIMISSELRDIDEAYAPGVKHLRKEVYKLLPGRLHWELPHRIIDSQIKDASKQYRILVIKTSSSIPYSNIYIELDSGYWNTNSETELRNKIEAASKKTSPTVPMHGDPPAPPATGDSSIPPTDQLPTLPSPSQNTPPAPSNTPVPVPPAPATGSAGSTPSIA